MTRNQLDDIAIHATISPAIGRQCETLRLTRLSMSLWRRGLFKEGMKYAVLSTAQKCLMCAETCLYTAQFWRTHLLIRVRNLRSGLRVLDGIKITEGDPAAKKIGAALSVTRGALSFVRGGIDTAVSEVNNGLRSMGRFDTTPILPLAYCILTLAAVRRMDVREGVQLANRLGNHALLGQATHMPGTSAWTVAQAAEANGRLAEVEQLIGGIIANPTIIRDLLISEPTAAPWLVRISRRLGNEEFAEISATVSHNLASSNSVPFRVFRASSLHAAGIFEKDPAKISQAITCHRDLWARASAREDFAELLAERCSHREEALEHLQAAANEYSQCGAKRDFCRVADSLRKFGHQHVRIHIPKQNRTASHGLTHTEFTIAKLVGQGLTNRKIGDRMFISRNTVAFHLKKIFRKMNITSRAELAVSIQGWL